MTKIAFPSFPAFVQDGDSVTVQQGGFTFTATVYFDDDACEPPQRDEGFWPSSDPSAPGYVEPGNFDAEMAKAEAVYRAWLNDEWFYCGIAVTVQRAGVELLGQYECALWSVEANYPGSDNTYLDEVASEQASEALRAATLKLSELCEA